MWKVKEEDWQIFCLWFLLSLPNLMQQYKAENLPLEQREIIWGKFGPNNFYLGKKPNQTTATKQTNKQNPLNTSVNLCGKNNGYP